MALPQASSGPRIVGKDELAASTAGQEVQLQDLRKQARTAATTLFVLAGLQLVLGGGIFTVGFLASSMEEEARGMLIGAGLIMSLIGLVFLGLGFWARKNPLPAAITGLVLFVSLWALDFIVAIASDQPETAARGILIKIIIVVALAKAVSAGVKYRDLRRRLNAAP